MSADHPIQPALPSHPATRAPILPSWCWIVVLALVLLKLALVSTDETLAYSDDDYGYVVGASTLHWGAVYDTYSFSRQPVYHLFLAGADVFGLPARLWIEFTWIAAAAIMLIALRRMGLSIAAALAAFTLVLFHPWTIMLFNRFLSDSLYGALLLVFLSALAAGLTQSTRRSMLRWGIVAAISGALAANTRVESVLIYGALAVAALCLAGLHHFARADRRVSRQRAAWIIALPLFATIGLTQAIKLRNCFHIGLYITNDLEGMPGFNKLYGALIAIRPANPDLRLSVPRDVRYWAYVHSPTFAQLRPFLEDDPGMARLTIQTENMTGVKGEYGAWTVWGLRVAAWKLHPWPKAPELNAFYVQAGDEILAALKAEPAKGRWTPVTFIPPEWGLLMRAIPASLGHCWQCLLEAQYQRLPDEKIDAGGIIRANSVGDRRSTLIDLNEGHVVSGSAWHRKNNIQRLDLCKQRLARLVHPLAIVAAILIGAGTLIGGLGIRRRIFPARWYILSALLLTAIAARIAIFTLMDATGYAVQMRYMFPIAAPIVILAVINAEVIVMLIIAKLRPRPKPQPS